MKLLVFSDIHGSLPAVRRMTALAERHEPDAVIVLGDILYHGPRNRLPEGYDPAAAAAALAPLAGRIIAVKGNCDSEVDESLLPFPLAAPFAWIVGGNAAGGGCRPRICATHGHRWGPGNPPPLQKNDVLLFGHTHVPMARTASSGIHMCNPGSLSLPKEGSPPCYGLFDGGVFLVLTEQGDPHLRLDCLGGEKG